MDEQASIPATWRALAVPRRSVPVLALALALASAEWIATGTPIAVMLDALLFAAFWLVAPAAWRRAAALARRDPGRASIAHAAYLLLCAAVIATLVGLLWSLGLRGTYVLDPPASGLLLTLFAVGGWGLGRDIDLEQGIESAERRAERNALEAERARLLALRAQLDPHFLFNMLNAIAEWCREDPLLAEQATLKLASMLRGILEGIDVATWPLAREVALLRELTELFALRDRDRYRFEIALPTTLPDASLPPMIALPLLENAIKHGPSAGHAGVVRIAIEERASGVVITIDNPGAFAGRREGGRGIAMVEQRLALAYGSTAKLTLRPDGERTHTELVLPRIDQK